MNLTKKEQNWIKQNREMISSIIKKQVDYYKDLLIEVETAKREDLIYIIREYKKAQRELKKATDEDSKDFTGI